MKKRLLFWIMEVIGFFLLWFVGGWKMVSGICLVAGGLLLDCEHYFKWRK